MSTTSGPLRVAIVGGGLCGLTCAVGLLQAGIDVQVYEAARKFGEVGAGVGLGRNAINILKALGVFEDVRIRTLQPDLVGSATPATPSDHPGPTQAIDSMSTGKWFRYISGYGDNEAQGEFDVQDNLAQGVHRAAFLDALAQHVDPTRTHFGKRCSGVTANESGKGVVICFQDGTTAEADVVLGADGIKSVVRRYVTGTVEEAIDPYLKHSHNIAYRTLVPAAKAKAAGCKLDYSERPLCVTGKNKHAILFTVRSGTMINIAAFVADPDKTLPEQYVPPPAVSGEDVSKETLQEAYADWGSELTKLFSCIETAKKWDINVVYPPIGPEGWTKGTVAILGDAAHGMQPYLGSGAGQGLEDAYLLSQLLTHPQTNSSNVADVLKAYAVVRQPRAQKVWDDSRRAGDIYGGRAGYDGVRVEELKSFWDHIWDHPVDADLEAAEVILIEQGVYTRTQGNGTSGSV